jgi:hypothetical protein
MSRACRRKGRRAIRPEDTVWYELCQETLEELAAEGMITVIHEPDCPSQKKPCGCDRYFSNAGFSTEQSNAEGEEQ